MGGDEIGKVLLISNEFILLSNLVNEWFLVFVTLGSLGLSNTVLGVRFSFIKFVAEVFKSCIFYSGVLALDCDGDESILDY